MIRRRLTASAQYRLAIYKEIVRDWFRGWSEADMACLAWKIEQPEYYSGGIVKITIREYRAWHEMNRRLLAQNPKMTRSPVLAWADGKGLFPMVRLT